MRNLPWISVLLQLATCGDLQANDHSDDAELAVMVKYPTPQVVLSALLCPGQYGRPKSRRDDDLTW